MPVERMWPTCMGLATLGELKSTTTVRRTGILPVSDFFCSPDEDGDRLEACPTVSKNKCSPRAADSKVLESADGLSVKFRKPAPAISTLSHHSETSSWARTSVASWRGFILRVFARDIRALLW